MEEKDLLQVNTEEKASANANDYTLSLYVGSNIDYIYYHTSDDTTSTQLSSGITKYFNLSTGKKVTIDSIHFNDADYMGKHPVYGYPTYGGSDWFPMTYSAGGWRDNTFTVESTKKDAKIYASSIITYNQGQADDGGTIPDDQTKTPGVSLTLSKNDGASPLSKTDTTVLSRNEAYYYLNYDSSTDYTSETFVYHTVYETECDGWATSKDGSKAYNLGATYTTDANRSLYPHFVRTGESATVYTSITFPRADSTKFLRDHYTLAGFSTSSTATEPDEGCEAGKTLIPSESKDLKYYAVWNKKQYEINSEIDPEGAGSISPDLSKLKVSYGTTYTVNSQNQLVIGSGTLKSTYTATPSTTTTTDYSFDGWYIGSAKQVSGTIDSDKTFIAKFKAAVTIDVTVDADAGGVIYESGTTSKKSSITFSVKSGTTYAVSDTNNTHLIFKTSGTTVKTIIAEPNSSYSPTYEFTGFNPSSGTVSATTFIDAKFSPRYSVSTSCGSDVSNISPAGPVTVSSQDFTATVTGGIDITEDYPISSASRTAVVKHHYEYVPTWSVKSGSGSFSTTTGLTTTFTPTSNSTIQASATKTETATYYAAKITYNPGAGTGEEFAKYTDWSTTAPTSATRMSFTASANPFTAPTGYIFKHWNTRSDDLGTTYEGNTTYSDIPINNITLYAIWYPEYITVDFYSIPGTAGYFKDYSGTTITQLTDIPQGATCATSDNYISIKKGSYSKQIYATSYNEEQYIFSSWSTIPSTLTENTQIFANFTRSFEIWALYNTGANISNISPNHAWGGADTTTKFTATRTKTDEWGTVQDYTSLTGKIYNKWPHYNYPTKWTISSGSGTFTAVDDSSVKFSPSSNSTIYANASVSEESGSLYRLEIAYDGNGSSGEMTSSYSSWVSSPPTSALIVLKTNSFPLPTGKKFNGWCTNTAGTGTIYSAGDKLSVTTKTTLYANWVDDTVNVVKLNTSPSGVGEVRYQSETGEATSCLIDVPSDATCVADGNKLTITKGAYFIKLYAVATDADYTFKEWSNVPSTITGDITITAKFKERETERVVTFAVTPTAGGTLDYYTVTVNSGTTFSVKSTSKNLVFSYGDTTVKTIKPTAAAGYSKVCWLDSSGNTVTSGTITEDTTLTMKFALKSGYWSWQNTIAKGEPVSNIGYEEWGEFIGKINIWRATYMLDPWEFTYPTVEDKTFYAELFNQAVKALTYMYTNRTDYFITNYTKISVTPKSKGDIIKAEYFEGTGSLKDALNNFIANCPY